MPGWFDVLHSGLLRQPDANEEARQFLDQQAAANAGAVTGDANAPFSGAYAKPPGSPPAGPPIGVAAPGPQEPMSMQTPKSWGSIMMDLSRQNQQEQQFNRSLGGIFGTLSQPVNRERVAHTFDTQPLDPLKLGETAMSLSSQQQGQDRANMIARMVNDPKTGPDIARKLNMDWTALKAGLVADPGLVSKIATSLGTPTEKMRDIGQTEIQLRNQGVPEEVIKRTTDLIRTGMLPGPAQTMAMAEIAFKRDNPGKELPWKEGDPTSFDRYSGVVAARTADRTEAQSKKPGTEATLNDIERQLDEIENDPNLPELMNKITPTSGSWSQIATSTGGRALAQKIDQLVSERYVQGLGDSNLGNRKTQQEMVYVGKALAGALGARNINQEDFIAGIHRLRDRVYETHANTYGETGDLTSLDSKYHGYLNDSYREGPLSEGITGAPKRKPLTDTEKTWFKSGIAANRPRSELIQILRNNNFNTKELQ